MKLIDIERSVHSCKKCGVEYGNSACGFGKVDEPKFFMIGMNPWVNDHKFKDGRGITILKKKLEEWGFDDFFFDNVVKCEMPGDFKPNTYHVKNCIGYLLEQVELIKPKAFILFGRFAVENLGYAYRPWVKVEPVENIPVYIVPHFSAVNYSIRIEDYYEKFRRIIYAD